MTPQDVLIEARRLIAEKGWTQRDFAGLGYDDPCSYDNPRATCFCADGAIRRAALSHPDDVRHNARDFLEQAADTLNIWDWNDDESRTKDEVLAAFDKAIALSAKDSPGSTEKRDE